MNRIRTFFIVLSLMMASLASARMSVTPVKDSSFVEVRESELPGEVFKFRMPEYVDSTGAVFAENVIWQEKKKGQWSFYWNASQDVKRTHLRDFYGTAGVNADTVDMQITLLNPFDKDWPAKDHWMFCLMAGGARKFHDPEGRRTFVHRDGKFVTIREFDGSDFRPRSLYSSFLNPAFYSTLYPRRCDARIMAKVSEDGQWILAIASNNGTGGTWNLNEPTSCIHQDWALGKLKSAKTKTLHCRLYLFKGSLDQLWDRYQKDFENEKNVFLGWAEIIKQNSWIALCAIGLLYLLARKRRKITRL